MKNTCKNTCKNPPLGGSEIFNSFQGLETGWLARQFLGNRLATSEGAVSNTQLLTVMSTVIPSSRWSAKRLYLGYISSFYDVSHVHRPFLSSYC